MTSEIVAPQIQLSIIVISYNTCEMTLACLKSIYEQTSLSFEVLVVDNASHDGSADAIAESFPQVRLLRESMNHGFGPAHHIAMIHAKGAFVLFLNPDTVILDRAIDKLCEFAKHTPESGIWGGRTMFADGTVNPTSCWQAMTSWSLFCQMAALNRLFPRVNIFNPEAVGHRLGSSAIKVDIVTGCLFLTEAKTWRALCGFDLTYKMYGEEADFCLRAKKQLGIQPIVTPEAVIVHYGGASEPSATEKMVRLMRAKTELVKDHFQPFEKRLGLSLLRWWPLSRWLMLSVLAFLLKSDDLRDRSTHWKQIWVRRAEWSHGFQRSV